MPKIPAEFMAPFKHDGYGYIWDANYNMAVTIDDHGIFKGTGIKGPVIPRGWGRIQYLPDGDAQMDEWAAWVRAAVGDATTGEEVARRMNEYAAQDSK